MDHSKIIWNNINVVLGQFWGEEFEFDEIFQIRPETKPVLREARYRIF
jgi:hypothetical protein